MPKVVFVNEHREIEVESGRLISEVADDLGIAVCREEFAGTGIGDYTVWVKCEDGSLTPLTFYEKWIKRCKGQRRMANRARILGDIKVWTQGGLSGRIGVPRPMDPAARPIEDGSEMFDHENDAAGTTWHPYGHPKAVGVGKREARKYEPPKKKKRTPKKKAEPAPKAAAQSDVSPPDGAPPDGVTPVDVSPPDGVNETTGDEAS
jgi:hypothetical protein